MIKKIYGLTMYEDEAGFIALHIVSAEVSNNIHDVYEITGFIQNIIILLNITLSVILILIHIIIIVFITHLKFFGHRVFQKNLIKMTSLIIICWTL